MKTRVYYSGIVLIGKLNWAGWCIFMKRRIKLLVDALISYLLNKCLTIKPLFYESGNRDAFSILDILLSWILAVNNKWTGLCPLSERTFSVASHCPIKLSRSFELFILWCTGTTVVECNVVCECVRFVHCKFLLYKV